jgi:predicted metal-dependent HD superfamily phosphohydrolase
MSDALRELAPTGLALPAALLDDVRTAYATPGRVYHDLAHVAEVARHFAEAGDGAGWERPHDVYLAVLYHDAVYVPGAKDNEARSADLACAALARWLPGSRIDAERVRALILLTARHGALAPGDVDAEAALFLDCDMAILGAPPAVFAAYDDAIAREYAALPRALYTAGRRAFLGQLLAKPRIFLSDHFHARLDAAARANLRRTLDALLARLGE